MLNINWLHIAPSSFALYSTYKYSKTFCIISIGYLYSVQHTDIVTFPQFARVCDAGKLKSPHFAAPPEYSHKQREKERERESIMYTHASIAIKKQLIFPQGRGGEGGGGAVGRAEEVARLLVRITSIPITEHVPYHTYVFTIYICTVWEHVCD